MDNKYQIFSDSYHKLFGLVEQIDEEVVEHYKKVVEKLPTRVIELMDEYKEFEHKGKNYKTTLTKYSDMIEFEHIVEGKDRPFVVTMYSYPFYADELLEDFEDGEIVLDPDVAEDEDGSMLIFSLTMSNTLKAPETKFYIDVVDGQYKGTRVEGGDIEIDYAVYIEKRDEEFYLTSTKSINELEIYKNEMLITYDELLEYALDEYVDEYEEEEDLDSEGIVFDGFIDDIDFEDLEDDYPYEDGVD